MLLEQLIQFFISFEGQHFVDVANVVIVDILGRDDFVSDVDSCVFPAFLTVNDFAELMHVDLCVVADGEAIVDAQYFMPENALGTGGRCLVLVEVLFCLLADLYLADLVVVVEELIGDVARVDHELQLRTHSLASQQIDIVRFHLEHQQNQQFVALGHCDLGVL